jgi:hypothetical protein
MKNEKEKTQITALHEAITRKVEVRRIEHISIQGYAAALTIVEQKPSR